MRAVRVSVDGSVHIGVEHEGQVRISPKAGDNLIEVLSAPGGWDTLSQLATRTLSQGEFKYLAPVKAPGKILCIGMNYRDHAEEQGIASPRPVIFAKLSSSVGAPFASIPLHSVTKGIDYEAELAVVIGLRISGATADAALSAVLGYTVANDVTARDLQEMDGQWTRGKSLDGFMPLGPALISPDEVGDPADLGIRCFVNGELRQDSNTRNLIIDIPHLIEFCSNGITLEPGDVILTGTPGGVGAFLEPPSFLADGDLVVVEIDRVGRLENTVGAVVPAFASEV